MVQFVFSQVILFSSILSVMLMALTLFQFVVLCCWKFTFSYIFSSVSVVILVMLLPVLLH